MYIVLNDTTYPNVNRWQNGNEVIYTGDSLTDISSVSGVIGVYANDGFLLRDDNVSNYERQIIRDGAITLTNLPEGYVSPPSIDQRVGKLEQTNSISFRTMAENGDIGEDIAAAYPDLFLPWEIGVEYAIGNLRSYNGVLYRCRQAHTSQVDFTPDVATSLWAIAGNPIEEWPEWVQPIGSTDGYPLGAKVSHNGKHWINIGKDNNEYEPGVWGWDEVPIE